jgi:septal ring factor EnvC (AmiA/AmiB activator)
MHKTLHRNLNMKNQGNASHPNFHQNNSTFESKDNELAQILEKEFRSLLIKIIKDLKEDSNKQINKVMKSIQESKQHGREIQQGNGNIRITEMLEMETSINQIQTTMDSIVRRQDQTEKGISEMESKTEELFHAKNHKEKIVYKNTTDKYSGGHKKE